MILSWYELPDDDRPPERIWLDDKALNEHFERVQAKYRRDDTAGPDWQSVPDSDFEQNELTARIRR